ncbi:MAG: response regulator [Pseudomonadota bacterium]
MPEKIEDILMSRPPTADRPLLGQTVLVIEDSRFASEALRLMCLRSGARVRRADSLRTAARHLATYRPSLLVVDLGLPDGCGSDLIADLSQAEPRIPLILGTSGDDAQRAAALAAGADGFLPKPLNSLGEFQQIVLDLMPAETRPRGLRLVSDDRIAPDRLALQDDLAHAASVLARKADVTTLDYLAGFIGGVARSADDAPLEEAARKLAHEARGGGATSAILRQIAGLVDARLSQRAVV